MDNKIITFYLFVIVQFVSPRSFYRHHSENIFKIIKKNMNQPFQVKSYAFFNYKKTKTFQKYKFNRQIQR